MAKVGGFREGSGRKPGSANKRTREIANRAAEEGITPLEYMLTIMRSPMPPEIQQAITDGKIDAETLTALSGWHKMRYEAARDSAPYIHPRLQTTALTASVEHTITISEQIPFNVIHSRAEAGKPESKTSH